MSFAEAQERGARCDRCFLRQRAEGGPVFTERNRNSYFAIVGEAPGGEEVEQGRPFVGSSGRELVTSLHSIGVPRGDATIANAICCRPPGNDLETLLHKCQQANKVIARECTTTVEYEARRWLTPIEACRPMLMNDLERFDKVLTVGKVGMRAVTRLGNSIMDMRGAPVTGLLTPSEEWVPRETLEPTEKDEFILASGGRFIRLLPTLHPAFILRQRRWTKVFRADLARAHRWFNGKLGWKDPKIRIGPSLSETRDFLYAGFPIYVYDVETDAKESLLARLRCIGIGTGEEAIVIPYLSVKGGWTGHYTEDERGAMDDLLRGWFTDRRIVKGGWNCGVYDRIVMEQQLGVTPAPIVDGIVIHRNVDSELPHGLAFVGSLFTDVARAWKASHAATEAQSDEELHVYNAADVVVNARILEPLHQAVKLRGQEHMVPIDHKIQSCCAGLHKNGIYVDQMMRQKLDAKYRGEAIEHLHALKQILGNDGFNPNSPMQIRKILFDEWGLTPIELTKLGDPSTNDETLRKLLLLPGVPPDRKRFLREIRGFRKAAKYRGTFLQPLRPWTEPAYEDDYSVDVTTVEGAALFDEEAEVVEDPRAEMSAKALIRALKKKEGLVLADGRVHSTWNCHVPTTGRLASSDPNAQNFVRLLRGVFVPYPGRAYVYADEDQLELRISAAFAGASRYLEAFQDPNGDPHSVTAEALYGATFKHAVGETRKKIRDFAKRFVYAVIYKAAVETIHETLTSVENDKGDLIFPWLTLRETGTMYDRWLSENREYAAWWDSTLDTYRQVGFLEEPVFHRRCFFMDGEDPNQIINWRVQACGASAVSKAMIRVAEEVMPFERWGPGTGLIQNGHDALWGEVPCSHGFYDGGDAVLGYHPPGVKCPAIDCAYMLKEAMSMPLPGYEGVVKLTAKPKIGFTGLQVS